MAPEARRGRQGSAVDAQRHDEDDDGARRRHVKEALDAQVESSRRYAFPPEIVPATALSSRRGRILRAGTKSREPVAPDRVV